MKPGTCRVPANGLNKRNVWFGYSRFMVILLVFGLQKRVRKVVALLAVIFIKWEFFLNWNIFLKNILLL